MTMHAAAPERAGGSAGGPSPSRRMPDMDTLYSRLAEADEDGDAEALAALAWELYGLLGLDEYDLHSLRARLHQLHQTTFAPSTFAPSAIGGGPVTARGRACSAEHGAEPRVARPEAGR